MELTTRELASVVLLTCVAVTLLAIPNTRRGLVPGLREVAKAFFVAKTLLVVFAYLLYTAGIAALASSMGAWHFDLLKDTLIITFFVGFPIVMNASDIRTGETLIRKVIRDTVGVSVILAFYLNIEPLPLWGELLLQPSITFSVLMAAVAQREEKTKKTATFFNVLIAITGMGLFVYTTVQIALNWQSYDLSQLLSTFTLSIWLPVLLMPFVYVLAFVMHCEMILVRLPFFNDKKKSKLRARWALLAGLRFSTHLASSFNGIWLRRIAQARGFQEGLRVMQEFRKSLRAEAEAERQHLNRLRDFAGVDGDDEQGLRLDRREFAETKNVLTDLFYRQMGWYRNRLGRYKGDMLDVLGDVPRKGLPADHSIELRVREDGQAWMAWRRTPCGWYFAVGGTKDLDAQWQYDGAEPPSRFPSSSKQNWRNATLGLSSGEWSAPDRRAALSV
jgi:hypothetical protein